MSYSDWKPLKPEPARSELPELADGVTRGEMDRDIMRALVDLFGTWVNCTARCRRAKTCLKPELCFRDSIRAVEEFADRLSTWTLLDGPRDLDDRHRPARDFFD